MSSYTFRSEPFNYRVFKNKLIIDSAHRKVVSSAETGGNLENNDSKLLTLV